MHNNYDYFFYVRNNGDIKEGGNSRNEMLFQYLNGNKTINLIINPSSYTSRLFSSIRLLFFFVILKNKRIFTTYSVLRLSLLS